jgi:hypothetical protein
VYHGIWGTAPFQSLYEPATGLWGAIAQTPVLYLFIAGLGLFSLLGLDWEPLLGALVPLAVGLGLVVAQAGRGAVGATFVTPPASPWDELRRRLVVGALHVTQPIGRLWSRLSYGLSHRQPWGPSALADLRPVTAAQWTDAWRDPADRLRDVETALRQEGGIIRRGGDFDRWDLELRWSGFGAARVLMAVEEHGGGHQLVRLRAWPAVALRGPLLLLLFGGLAAGAAEEGAIVSAVVLAGVAAYFTFRTVAAVAAAAAAVRRALARLGLGSS